MSSDKPDGIMMSAALVYAEEFGWPVFPLKPRSKKPPLTEHGSLDATTDTEVITAWWKRCPAANVALATAHKFFVLDVDPKNGGDVSLESLERKYGKLPDTVQQMTGGGGRQHLFALPDFTVHNSESAIAPGLDVRGAGGYVVAPPSYHPSGRAYVWDGLDPLHKQQILPAPEWLLDLIRRAAGSHNGIPFETPQKIPKGKQHKTLVSIAGTMRARGLEFPEIFEALRIINATRCTEPGPIEDIRNIAESICRYPPGSANGRPAGAEPPPASNSARGEEKSGQASADADAPTEKAADSRQWPAPLKPAAFYGIAGDLVDAYSPESEADPAAILTQFLVAIGNMIGRAPHFYAQGTRHYLNLDCVLVGATARGRKGSSFDQVMLPLRLVDSHWCEKRVASGLSSGEGLIYKVRDAIEKQEPIKEKGRTTGYRTVIADHGEEDKRLLVVEPEFARVLQVIERETNTLSPVIRQAWDTGNLGNLTKNSPLVSTGAHISIVGHITKAELDRLLTDTALANGFANRLLWLCVKRSKLLPEGGELHRMDLSPFGRHLVAIVACARKIGEMRRDEALREQWAAFYNRCARGGTGLFDAATNRAEAQTMRLACTYAYLDQCQTIKEPHLDAAIALWTFCEDSARFLFGSKLGDPTADQILEALRNCGSRGMTREDLYQLFQRHKSGAEIQRAVGVLLGSGLIRMETEPTSGRPISRYFAL